jgi:hypothetical protein
MGALVTMRDEPLEATPPERFEPQKYYFERVDEAKAKVAVLSQMTVREIETAMEAAHKAALADYERRKQEREELRARYEAMLAKAREWEPPTTDHEGLANFMIEQLEQSIEFDCWKGAEPPVRVSATEWYNREVEQAARELQRAVAALADEKDRAEGRSKWVADLKASLKGEKR